MKSLIRKHTIVINARKTSISIEDAFWGATLTNLAGSLGVAEPDVESQTECMDTRRQWRRTS